MFQTGSLGIWAQATSTWSPASAAYLCIRRWCGGATLSPYSIAPDWTSVWVVASGPVVLILLAILAQGPGKALRQVIDIVGHAKVIAQSAGRLLRAGRLLTALLGFTVLAWTTAQCLGFAFGDAERGRSDHVSLRRSRGTVELVVEHAIAAVATPLRDVAALGDNLALGAAAAALVLSTRRSRTRRSPFDNQDHQNSVDVEHNRTWQAIIGTCLVLYSIYRMFSRIAGGGDIPVGNCLILEVAIVPGLMLICDGFLLAWVLAEIRDGDPDDDRTGLGDLGRVYRMMPAACLGCLAALPARYTTVTLLLASQHIPAAAMATELGRYIRWALGPGLIIQQAASLVTMGVIGGIAWSGGSIAETAIGFWRLLRREGGRLAFVTAIAALASAFVSAPAYAVLLLLPPAGWVLPAADAYSHYATLPVGLLTLAFLLQLGERSLPSASLAESLDESAQIEAEVVAVDASTASPEVS